MKIGQKVQLKPSYAKWHLNHQEIYDRPSGLETEQDKAEIEIENYMHILCCFGVSITGKIIKQGCDSKTWGILWTIPTTRKKVYYFATNTQILTTKD